MTEQRRFVSGGAVVISAADRVGLHDLLRSGVAWLGMLGALQRAVRDEDWTRASVLARRQITFPQPYEDADD